MQKTTVYLPDALKRRLAQAAHRRGQPEAALIRAAIERLLEGEVRPRPTLPLFRSGAAAAKTTRLLTLDERHFRPMRPLWGEAFTLLPADKP